MMPHSANDVDSYEHMMGTPMDPEDHDAHDLPAPTDDRWGEILQALRGAPEEDSSSPAEDREEDKPMPKAKRRGKR